MADLGKLLTARSLRSAMAASVLAFFVLGGPASAAGPAGIGTALKERIARALPGAKIPIIVRMHEPVDIQQMAVPTRREGASRARERAQLVGRLMARAAENRPPLQALLQRQNIHQARDLWIINGMAFEATPAQIEEIAALPEVASVEYDAVIVEPRVEPLQVSAPAAEPNLELVNAPVLWNAGYFGRGATVAIVDSGVDADHPDLAARWRGGSNSWFDPHGEHPNLPHDASGHGTHVAGVVLGGDNSGSLIGVAPEAQWIGVKIFDDAGSARTSTTINGLQWLLDPDRNPLTDDMPDIVNNSWGGPEYQAGNCDDSFRQTVQVLKAAGMAVVFSAGNTGPDAASSLPPANYPESFAVGSVGTFETETLVSDFSARGPSACDGTIFPEVVAPGNYPHRLDGGQVVAGIFTSDLSAGGLDPFPYTYVAGTSFAAPHASGVMALLLEAFPDAPVSALEDALIQSATDLGSLGPDNSYGFGLIDAAAAFDYLDGQRNISVTDSILPETDHRLPFAEVSLGGQRNASVNVRNTGSLPLQLGSVDDTGLPAPFTITADNCSGRLLSAGSSCSIALRFAPSTVGGFTGSLVVVSNVIAQERITVEVSGTGVVGGTRQIAVTDSVLPATDRRIDFDQVEPGQDELASIFIENAGSLSVQIAAVDGTDIVAPFFIASDDCSNRLLAPGSSCRIVVRFAPTGAGSFAGGLDIVSDADNLPLVAFDLIGTANTPPVPPRPLQPADGATVGPDVTFYWSPASDADGDPVRQFLVYAADPAFVSPIEGPVGTIAATLLGGGGLLLGGLAAGLRRRRKQAALLVAAGLVVGLVACGGGNGGDGGSDLPADAQSTTVQNLTPGTNYYWKMVARDSRGGETESGVRSFTVE